ncbi:hypothetical protein PHISP_06073 [Aspergillus sp. HF37]|nr:hypothetical protein PHISP_06073 [Aspergillus sp. HF37]
MKIEGPKMPMENYLGLVKSDTLRWRLALTVATEYARIPELVEIAALKNIVALEVISPPHAQSISDSEGASMATLNNRVVRTWSELAQSSGAFAYLSILRLHHQTELSGVALHYMRDFPSLRFIIVHNCPGVASAGDCTEGWEVAAIPELLSCTELHDCYTGMIDIGEKGGQMLSQDIPVLDFQIGPSIHRASKRAGTPVCLRRCEESYTPEPAAKKHKAGGPSGRNRSKKRVMKERKGDLDSVLAELK